MPDRGITFATPDATANQVRAEFEEHIARCETCQPLSLAWCPTGQRLSRSIEYWVELAQEALTKGRPVTEEEAFEQLTASDFAVLVDKGGGVVHLLALPVTDLRSVCGVSTAMLAAKLPRDLNACQACWTSMIPMEVRKALSQKYMSDPDEAGRPPV
jgi:hypothetical protein